jgi:hypothetical protein
LSSETFSVSLPSMSEPTRGNSTWLAPFLEIFTVGTTAVCPSWVLLKGYQIKADRGSESNRVGVFLMYSRQLSHAVQSKKVEDGRMCMKSGLRQRI